MGLTPAHRHELEVGSGITPGAIAERGYYTATKPEEIERLGFKGKQSIVPCLVLPVCGVDGDVVTYQIKPEKPRNNSRHKPVKYETLAGSQMRLDVPPGCRHLLDDPTVAIWFTEGLKKGDSLSCRGLLAVALLGVWNWRGANDFGGIAELADWERIPLNGRVCYIAFDSDVMQKPEVKKALVRFAKFLKRKGAKSVIPIVPALPGVSAKLGVDDYFVGGGTIAKLKACAAPALLESNIPRIVLTGRTGPEIHDDAMAALLAANKESPQVFVRGGELSIVVFDERRMPTIEPMGYGGIRNRLSNCATWWTAKQTKEGPEYISVPFAPKDVCEHFLSERAWPGVPGIIAVIKAPVLANGALTRKPGYCPNSRYYIASEEEFPVFDGSPADAAKWIFEEFLCDFPFVSDADRAHALAVMLLPILRPSIGGPTPLHMFEASHPESGKSTLARVCLMPTAGNEIAATPGTNDEEEWRKKITSSLRSGRPYILLDNLTKRIESASLDNVLTSTEWEDRVLATSKNIVLQNHAVWVATSNNVELSKDLTTRSIVCRLDANMVNPSERQFRHKDIEQWVRVNRMKIVSALCAIAECGTDKYQGTTSNRYGEWSLVLGAVLSGAGVTGFLGNQDEWRNSADPVTVALGGFAQRWWVRYADSIPCKATDLRELWEEDDDLFGMLGSGGEASRTTKLGFKLRGMRGQVFGVNDPIDGKITVKIVKSSERGGSTSYKLQKLSTPTISGTTPTISTDSNGGGSKPTPTTILGSNGGGGEGLDFPSHVRAPARETNAFGDSAGKPLQPPPNGDNPHRLGGGLENIADDDEETIL